MGGFESAEKPIRVISEELSNVCVEGNHSLTSALRCFVMLLLSSDTGSINVGYCSGHLCSICMNDEEPPSKPMLKYRCGHIVHLDCGLSWALKSDLCPYCRSNWWRGEWYK